MRRLVDMRAGRELIIVVTLYVAFLIGLSARGNIHFLSTLFRGDYAAYVVWACLDIAALIGLAFKLSGQDDGIALLAWLAHPLIAVGAAYETLVLTESWLAALGVGMFGAALSYSAKRRLEKLTAVLRGVDMEMQEIIGLITRIRALQTTREQKAMRADAVRHIAERRGVTVQAARKRIRKMEELL